jgi:hypothetical protein
MNLNGDEERIRQLYRDIAVDDRRQAPTFARVLASAEARGSRSRQHLKLNLAFVVASLCLAVLVAMFVFSRPKQLETARDNKPLIDERENPAGKPDTPIVSSDSSVRPVRRARHRRLQNRTTLALRSLFAWRSPTASLLKVPEDKLLNSLPRLGESIQTIKSISPDELN